MTTFYRDEAKAKAEAAIKTKKTGRPHHVSPAQNGFLVSEHAPIEQPKSESEARRATAKVAALAGLAALAINPYRRY